MYKKGGIIMLIGFAIIIFSATLVMFNHIPIKNALKEKQNAQSEIVNLQIPVEDINELVLYTSNDKVKIVDSELNTIEIKYTKTEQLEYTLTKESNKAVVQKKKAGIKLFNFDFGFLLDNAITEIKIPKHLIKKLNLNNSNTEINIEDWSIEEIYAKSSNGRINLKNVNCNGKVELRTSNSSINCDNVKMNNMVAESSNGGIHLNGVNAISANLKTSNSSIEVKNSEILDSLYSKTSNGKIECGITNSKKTELISSNSSISLDVFGKREEYNQNLGTSNSSISINGDRLEDKKIDKEYTGAEKEIIVKTSNGRIELNFKK